LNKHGATWEKILGPWEWRQWQENKWKIFGICRNEKIMFIR